MSAQKLAGRYAKSILDLALEKGAMEEVYTDVADLKDKLKSNRDLYLFLKSPIINPSKKRSIIETMFKGKVHELTFGFYEIIVRKRRESYLPEIADAFIEMYNSKKSITTAQLTTAVPVDQSVIDKITAFIKGSSKNSEVVKITTKIDKDLLGGFILQFEDKLYDCSVSHRLNKLKAKFKENKYIRKY